MKGRKPTRCQVCGCTEARACPGGCHWVRPNLCSSCVWRRGDGRYVAPEMPKRPSAAWRKAYRAGIAAMLVTLERAAPTRFLVNGAVVYVYAGHHIDAAADAAEALGVPQKVREARDG